MANTNATKPQESMSEMGHDLKEKSKNVGQAASDLASSVGQKASEAASNLGQKASDAASNLGKKATDAASAVGDKADDATAAVGHGMKSLAGTIRGKAPDTGMMHGAAGAVADTLQRGGDYLEDRQLSGIARDVNDIVRRYPFAAIGIGLCLGFLVARATMSSRS
jgi:ElaB/YqjD/DUF883 family membrane-anchored ribosome-binding protein